MWVTFCKTAAADAATVIAGLAARCPNLEFEGLPCKSGRVAIRYRKR